MANLTTPGYLPFLKTFGFVFLSPPLCCFLFVAGKTDGPGICFTLQYLRKGFNSFPLTALYHVFTVKDVQGGLYLAFDFALEVHLIHFFRPVIGHVLICANRLSAV